MSPGRIVAITAAALAGALALSAPAGAKYKCDATSKCTNPDVVVQALATVDAACPCGAAASAKAYKQCWKPTLKDLAKELGKDAFPKKCQKEAKKTLSNSLCGRPGYVLCRKENKKGEVTCKVKKTEKCSEEFPPSSTCGAFVTCTEACNPTDCTTTTTVPPSTTSTTLLTTTTTIASTTSTTILVTTSTLVTTTSTTTLATTTSTLATTTTTAPPTTTTTVPATCGNGVREGTEECDGSDLGGAMCPGGSAGGAFPTCTVGCMLDFSACPSTTTTTLIVTTTMPPPSTTTTTMASTTSTLIVTTTTMESTTTSTTLPGGTILKFTTGAPSGDCGVAKTGGANGTPVKTLHCGGLNIGHGGGTVPEGPTPAGADTLMNTACAAGTCTVSARTAAQTGSNKNCSDTSCDFGPGLPIANPASPTLSTCVHNTFGSPVTGTLSSDSGTFTGDFPLSSQTTVTGNLTSPCPKCLGGTVGVAGSGTCDSNWAAAGALPGQDAGNACTPVNANGDTYDCRPQAGGAPEGVLPPFSVPLTGITTGTSSKTGSLACAGVGQGAAGCFGQPTCDYFEENGAAAGSLTPGTHTVTLGVAFCIPSAGNLLVNASAGLPGPGATSLPGTLELLP